MNPEPKSRVDEAVPKPTEAAQLTEEQKQALEAEGEIAHAHGKEREELAQKAAQTERP